MVRPDGVVKLTDFGIAQARDAAPLTRTGMVVGTAQYLSPEQAQGMEVTAASDVYSLGVVAYECLSGERPFDGASQVAIALAHINRPPPPLPADVPPAVRLLVERALAKDAADRFPDGGAFAQAIRRVASGGALAAVPGPATAPTQVVDGGLADARTQVLAATGATAVAGAGALGPPPGPPGRCRRCTRLRTTTTGARTTSRRRPLQPGAVGPARPRPRPAAAARRGRLLRADQRQPRPRGTPPDATPATTSAGATGIFLDPGQYVGRPVEAVQAELEALGLTVVLQPADDAELEALGREFDAGAVVRLEPADQTVPPASEITVTWTEEGFAPDDGETAAPETTSRGASSDHRSAAGDDRHHTAAASARARRATTSDEPRPRRPGWRRPSAPTPAHCTGRDADAGRPPRSGGRGDRGPACPA